MEFIINVYRIKSQWVCECEQLGIFEFKSVVEIIHNLGIIASKYMKDNNIEGNPVLKFKFPNKKAYG